MLREHSKDLWMKEKVMFFSFLQFSARWVFRKGPYYSEAFN